MAKSLDREMAELRRRGGKLGARFEGVINQTHALQEESLRLARDVEPVVTRLRELPPSKERDVQIAEFEEFRAKLLRNGTRPV